jgi:prevent-host-death family protein
MPTIVNIHEAKTHLPKLLVRVSIGEEIVITKAGKPVARLVAIDEEPAQRLSGTARGQVVITPDSDAPLPQDLVDAFEA